MSQALIERLKVSHQAIVDSIDRIQPLARNYMAAKPRVCEMRERLLAHFGGQDKELFERLSSFYQNDRQSIKMIEFLIHDLKEVKIRFLIFFEKYTGELADRGSKDFPLDFIQLSKDMLSRIKVEEDYLLPLLDKLPELPLE
ncbi:MAG TPA: hemerythrin domain-containing protein [Candidatus Omnitrophota bacterium]|nr:hemerythrin domain-containing protein [Candidatus Omnitrophota bacterium]HPD85541.1 hemerythrin domain-containing protein [Candidatus Omnitrophota bacterium]HRZ04419.1 hemerythrin domain-containing protein [Candidatus Omnitrophota bacterium]